MTYRCPSNMESQGPLPFKLGSQVASFFALQLVFACLGRRSRLRDVAFTWPPRVGWRSRSSIAMDAERAELLTSLSSRLRGRLLLQGLTSWTLAWVNVGNWAKTVFFLLASVPFLLVICWWISQFPKWLCFLKGVISGKRKTCLKERRFVGSMRCASPRKRWKRRLLVRVRGFLVPFWSQQAHKLVPSGPFPVGPLFTFVFSMYLLGTLGGSRYREMSIHR